MSVDPDSSGVIARSTGDFPVWLAPGGEGFR
jgi:hypothetical protein